MATMVNLLSRQKDILDETYDRIKDAEDNRPLEFKSVIKVQAWFRAQKVRAYIKHLNSCATEIQRRWRGFLGRRRYRKILRERIFIMKLDHYNFMATQIQKTWKGYYTRKYVANYYSRKRYMQALVIKNAIIRSELEGYAEQQEMQQQMEKEKQDEQRQKEWVAKNHFLLSTTQQPGIYNSPFLPYPDRREYFLRNFKVEEKEMRKSASKKHPFDPACRTYELPRHTPLPPLQPRQMGPFRDPRDVQKQRYRPFNPSLRVSTDYEALEKARQAMKDEEWVNRYNDNIFVPFKKREEKYEPLLHTTTSYGQLPYGNQYFREEFPDKFLSKSFQSLVPPIPLLDKLNHTYSQGEV